MPPSSGIAPILKVPSPAPAPAAVDRSHCPFAYSQQNLAVPHSGMDEGYAIFVVRLEGISLHGHDRPRP